MHASGTCVSGCGCISAQGVASGACIGSGTQYLHQALATEFCNLCSLQGLCLELTHVSRNVNSGECCQQLSQTGSICTTPFGAKHSLLSCVCTDLFQPYSMLPIISSQHNISH